MNTTSKTPPISKEKKREYLLGRRRKNQAAALAHQEHVTALKKRRETKMRGKSPLTKYRDGLMAKRMAATTTEAASLLEPFQPEDRRRIIAALTILCL